MPDAEAEPPTSDYPVKVTVVEEGTRSELEFRRPLLRLGRAIDNDIRLSGQLVSRHHCRIELEEDGAWVVDLGSSNGIQVNGRQVERAPLRPGDELSLGGARLQVEYAAPARSRSERRRERERERDEEAATLVRFAPAARAPGAPASAAEGRRSASAFGAVGLATSTGEAGRERESLRVFADITHALVKETELMPLLRRIVDGATALVDAERGFLLLLPHGAGGASSAPGKGASDPAAMTVRVARNFDRTDIPLPSSRLSSGIAGQVIETGRPILSVDAGRDERFATMASVEDLRLRSVLCVPVRIDERVEGVLYVDNRLQRGAFNESHLDLVELLAAQAAVAIRNARLVAALRERNERLAHSRSQIEALNQQLGRKVRDRDTELAVVRAELGRERGRYDYTAIVGASEGMRQVFQTLDRVIETELPVLVVGESGTGKELIARAVHYNGPRKGKPFVSINCAALPDSLLESELFGHVRGAFTGADRTKKGLLELASGGTLFLDEIGDTSPAMQRKLLRVLQEGEVRPLGSSRTVQVDVRLLSASHRDLEAMVRAGQFREDLFYRVNVLTVHLPRLADRREDIPLLAEALLARAARETGREVPVIPQETLALLVDHDWPGNVRELENEMRRLVVLSEGLVEPSQLSATIRASNRGEGGTAGSAETGGEGAAAEVRLEPGGDLREAVARFEREAIHSALQRHGGNKSRAAAELGLSRFALQRKMDKYELVVTDAAGGSGDDEE